MISIYKNLDLENRPETYKTILKHEYGNNTETSKVRRKMSKLIKYGSVCSKTIKNLNNGRDRIFYLIEKEYFIVFTKTSCYYCENIESEEKYITLVNSYELNCVNWISMNTINIKMEEVEICF